MPSEAILAFDTSGSWCAVALRVADRVRAHRFEPMARGQGERLFPAIEETMAEAAIGWADLAAIGWADLAAIGVGTGPGNFTGIRIGVAAARGLAMGLRIPAIGIDRFAALGLDGPDLPVLLPAARGMAWLARPGVSPLLVDPTSLREPVIADPADFPELAATPPAYPLALAIARLTEARRHSAQPRPAPLYLRPADAAPPSEGAPALLD